MRRSVICVLAAALPALAGAAPASAAALRFTPMGQGEPVRTDGRFAVDASNGVVRVRDTRTKELFRVAYPHPDCRIGAVGSGLLLWTCPVRTPGSHYEVAHVVDLATRSGVAFGAQDQFREASLVTPCSSGDDGAGLWWVTIGRTWVQGVREPCYHGEQFFKLNWHTGAPGTVHSTLGSTIDDLDAASGARTLCPPVRAGGLDIAGERNTAIAGRWTIHQARTGDGMVLQRCGSRAVRLRGLHPYSQRFALTARFAIWTDDDDFLNVRDLRTGRVRRAELPGPLRYPSSVSLAATEGFVYLSAETPQRWRVKL